MKARKIACRAALALALLAPCATLAQPRYSVQRLTPAGATWSNASTLTESGQVLLTAYSANGTPQAFLYTPGPLGSAPTSPAQLLPPGAQWSQAQWLGSGGHAVIYTYDATAEAFSYFLYDPALGVTSLTAAGFCPQGRPNASGTIPGAACSSTTYGPAALFQGGTVVPLPGDHPSATHVSDAGQVVGPAVTGTFYAYSRGTLVDTGLVRLAEFGDDTEGPINGSGDVAGGYLAPSGEERLGYSRAGVIFDAGAALPTGQLLSGNPRGMNGRSDIFGNANPSSPQQLGHGYVHAFAGGVLRDVGGLGGETCLHGINSAGDLVGHSRGPGNFAYLGFPAGANALFTGGKVYDINTLVPPGSGVLFAEYDGAINDRGQILLQGWDATGNQHAYLLTPAPVTAARLGGLQRADGWFRSNVTVTLTAADAVNGIREIHYRTDGGAETVVRPATLAATATATLTVSQAGTHAVTFWAVSGQGGAEIPKTQAVSIDRGSLVISTAALPGATVGAPYSAQLAAIQGSAPYRWTAVTAPPCGLTLGTTGLLSGTPTCEGSASFLVQVTGANQAAVRSYLTVAIAAPLVNAVPDVISTTPNPDYNRQVALRATGGVPPYRWSVSPATPLPPTMGLDGATLVSSGNEPGASFPLTLTVTDARGASATRSVTLVVEGNDVVLYPPGQGPWSAVAGQPFAFQFGAGGGAGEPYTFEFDRSWTVPPAISLDPATGLVSGTLTVPGYYSFMIRAVDSQGNASLGLPFGFSVQ